MTHRKLSLKPLNFLLKQALQARTLKRVALGAGALAPAFAFANPTGGTVVGGQASITAPNANSTVINQSSQSAIINWQQFSIGSNQYVQFVQPDSSSVILNRVVGGNPSSILGSMQANGQVFLVNPNGIFFGKGATLDVQGLVASTLDINNNDFMAGHYVFRKSAYAPDASVVNQGAITANANGYVVLAGDYAENDGVITAQTGHVVLASGTKTTLTLAGDSLLSFAVNRATLANLAGVNNAGTISADGGTVVMTADVANQLKATVVNNTGLVEAHSISAQGGSIYFTATGGNIENSGALDASATDTGVAGGHIVLKGDGLTDLTSTSKIITLGDNAKGGTLEISGHSIKVRGTTKVGAGGSILFDPATITINSGATGGPGTFGASYIASHLNAGSNILLSASNSIVKGTATSITATTGTGALTLKAGAGGIKLNGLTINMKGAFTASHYGTGTVGNMSFGRISAGTATFKDGTNTVRLAGGGAGNPSLKTKTGDVTISAGAVRTTNNSAGALYISAASGITLDANIGSSSGANAFHNDVTLKAATSIDVARSIYAGGAGSARTITITAGHDATIAASNGAINLIAGGGIDISAGGGVGISGSSAGAIKIKAGIDTAASSANRNLQIVGHSGSVNIHAGNASMSGAVPGTADTSITLSAGHDISINGQNGVTIQAGSANASPSTSVSGTASTPKVFKANAGISISAQDISVNAASGNVGISGGSAKAKIQNNDVYVDVSAQAGVTLAATGGTLKVSASNGSVHVHGGHAEFVAGNSNFANDSLQAKSAVSLSASSVNLSGKTGVNIQAGNIGMSASGTPVPQALVTLKGDSGVTLNGTNTLSIAAASGAISIAGGGISAQGRVGSASGILKESFTAADMLTAGAGGIAIQAGAQLDIHGGDSMNVSLTSGAAGQLTANIDASVTLKTTSGGNITLSAGKVGTGSLSIAGGTGASVRVAGTNSAAKQTVTILDGISVNAAGALNLVNNSGGIKISAGTGAASVSHGGTNTLTLDQSAILQAGGNIAITATGSLSVLAEPFGNVNVYGSTAGAVNTETVTGYAKLLAGNDLTISVGSNMVLRGGSGTYARAGASNPTSGAGHLTINEYTDASLSAARDIVIKNVGGNFSMSGTNSNGYIYAEAFGGTSHAVVTAVETGNATLNAGRDIVTASGGSIAGNLTVRGAYYGDAYAGNKGQTSATGHADVTVSAGRDINLKVGGTVNISGGWSGSVSGSAYASTAAATAKAVSTTNTTISAAGNLTIAAGGSLHVHGGSNVDASAYKAGLKNSASVQSKVTLSAGGNMLLSAVNGMSIAGGDSAYGKAEASGANANNHATVDAGTTLSATGNLTLNAGGNLTVRGGNDPHGSVKASNTTYSNASLGLTVSAVTTLSAGGNIDITGSSVDVTGGGAAGMGVAVLASAANAKVNYTASNGVVLNATGTVGISATVGSVAIHGGSPAAASATITANNGGTAVMTTNSDVNVTGGTVLLTAGTNIDVAQGAPASTPATVTSSAGGVATLTTSAKAVVTGNAMSLTAGSNVNWNSGGSLNVGSGSLSSMTADPIAQYLGVAAGKSPSLKISAGGTVNVGTTTLTGSYIYLAANQGAVNSAGATLTLPTNTVVQWVSPTAGSMDVSGTYTSLPFGVHNVIFGAKGYTTNLTIGATSAATLAGDNVGFAATGNITGSALATASKEVFEAGGAITALTQTGNLTVVSGTSVNLDDTAYTSAVTVYGTSTPTVNVSLDTSKITLASGQTINADDTAYTGAVTANGGTTKQANFILNTTGVTLTGGQQVNVDDTAETSATTLTMSGTGFGDVMGSFGGNLSLGGTATATSLILTTPGNMSADGNYTVGAGQYSAGGNLTLGGTNKATSLILTTPGNITGVNGSYNLGAAEFTAGGNIDLSKTALTLGNGTIKGVTGDSKLLALLGLVNLKPASANPNGVFTAGAGNSITLGNLTMTGSYLQLNADAFNFNGTVKAPGNAVVQLQPVTTGASLSIEQKLTKEAKINFGADNGLTLFPTVVIGGQNETGAATIGKNGLVNLNNTNLFVITTGKVTGLELLLSNGIVGDLTTIIYPGGKFHVPTAGEIMGAQQVFGFDYPPIVMYGGAGYGEGVSYSDPLLAPCLVVVASEDKSSYKCVSGGE